MENDILCIRACMLGSSLTQTTTAFSGGLRYITDKIFRFFKIATI